jgi:hypothetical protein
MKIVSELEDRPASSKLPVASDIPLIIKPLPKTHSLFSNLIARKINLYSIFFHSVLGEKQILISFATRSKTRCHSSVGRATD